MNEGDIHDCCSNELLDHSTPDDRRRVACGCGHRAGVKFPEEPAVKLGLVARSAAVFVAAAVFSGACSSDSDPLTLEEYFAELEAIDADVDSQFEALFADFPEDEDAFADEANLEVFKDVLVGFPRITSDFIDSTKDLDPPSEVEDAHNHLVETGQALLVAYEEGVDVISAAETMAEFETLNLEVEPTINAARAAVEGACLAVLDIARANEIHVSVTCEDE